VVIGITKYKCIDMDDKVWYGQTPTWFGDPLPSYVELLCPKCNKTYSRDIIRMVRPDIQEYCTCREPMPVFRYIEEVKE
jgi:hypothetical protein